MYDLGDESGLNPKVTSNRWALAAGIWTKLALQVLLQTRHQLDEIGGAGAVAPPPSLRHRQCRTGLIRPTKGHSGSRLGAISQIAFYLIPKWRRMVLLLVLSWCWAVERLGEGSFSFIPGSSDSIPDLASMNSRFGLLRETAGKGWIWLGAFTKKTALGRRRSTKFPASREKTGNSRWLKAQTPSRRPEPERYGFRCSCRRGISSTKLQGRNRLSSWCTRMPSQASRQALGEPGKAKR
jgi:hypothetical protein